MRMIKMLSNNMNNSKAIEYTRKEIVEVASGMLDGSFHYLEGAVALSSLRHYAGIEENDKDFMIFVGVASEIDHLPLGKFRENWSREALERLEPEIEAAIEWAKRISKKQCEIIIERFGA